MEAWVAKERVRELRFSRGMRAHKYRRLPVDQRPTFDNSEIDREIEFLERVTHQLENDRAHS